MRGLMGGDALASFFRIANPSFKEKTRLTVDVLVEISVKSPKQAAISAASNQSASLSPTKSPSEPVTDLSSLVEHSATF